MITKKTVVDQIEILRSGPIQVRLGLLLLEEGKEVDCKWHRTSIEPGIDVDLQMASVNAHLIQLGKAQVEIEDLSRIKAIVALIHTPKIISQFKEAVKS